MRIFTILLCAIIICYYIVYFALYTESSFASEIRIEGDRVVITNDNGDTIDTANLPKCKEVKTDDNIDINEKGISIGSVTNKDCESKNVIKSTKLENVTIINNGKATQYNRKKE